MSVAMFRMRQSIVIHLSVHNHDFRSFKQEGRSTFPIRLGLHFTASHAFSSLEPLQERAYRLLSLSSAATPVEHFLPLRIARPCKQSVLICASVTTLPVDPARALPPSCYNCGWPEKVSGF